MKAVLENVVKRGTGSKLYSKDFSMAGKTERHRQITVRMAVQISTIFPRLWVISMDYPKYSCIVVVHEPDTSLNNYYGADVAGPVFKRIAQKIFTDSPSTNEIKNLNKKNGKQEINYADYSVKISKTQENKKTVPNLKGMSGMDAVAILGNMGVKVK